MSQIETGLQKDPHGIAAANRHIHTFFSWEFLIPRPLSFLSNTLLFSGGLFFAWLEGHRGESIAGQGATAYTWVIVFILGWFAVQELLVQQAKYMWNDICDHERDQKIPANRARFVTRKPLTRQIPILCGGRWALGLLLAALLSPGLLAVVLAITILQITYERWAKPQAHRYPVAPLLIVAAGSVLKCLGGALAMGWSPGDHRLWFYGLALFGTGLVYGSTLWRLEADHFARRGRRFPRGQSAYFQKKGLDWLRAGSAVGILACFILMADGASRYLQESLSGAFTAPLLLLSFLAVDYLFNYQTDYRQYNLLDWRE